MGLRHFLPLLALASCGTQLSPAPIGAAGKGDSKHVSASTPIVWDTPRLIAVDRAARLFVVGSNKIARFVQGVADKEIAAAANETKDQEPPSYRRRV